MKDISIAKQRELQLLHLVSRAERGALLPEEAQQLREAITAGAAARSSAGGMQTRMLRRVSTRFRRALRRGRRSLACTGG
ncbi:hypothetical protein ABZ863_34985 [Saccharomonospora sp. NPDC046836]|uniref:hypothetical protein n=1 Tax=Saccharomonospora sp. NPDC046836 TaxID=3156921 RepID=UPI0034066A75